MKKLSNQPLTNEPEFINIELWRLEDENKIKNFIDQLKSLYSRNNNFRITDQLITKSFALLRVKLTKEIFEEIIEFKEIARVDRPTTPIFNPFELKKIDIGNFEINPPNDNATGILVIDSGVISNHPLLEKCIGTEDNFQVGEEEFQDTVGHGTAVAGCATYGDIEKCVTEKTFNATNWIYSAKVMYAEKNQITNEVIAKYDPEKLVENQLKVAIERFLPKPNYNIRVVNISLGDANEVWHKKL